MVVGRIICFHFFESTEDEIAIGILRMKSDGVHFEKRTQWQLANRIFTDSRGHSFDEYDVTSQMYVALAEQMGASAVPMAEQVAISEELKSGFIHV